MATQSEIERFLDRWTTSWVKRFDEREPIFHPGGGVRYPGSRDLFDPDSQPAMTDMLREIAPDLRMELTSWAANGDVLMAEWSMQATVAGRRFHGGGCNRFLLKGDKALEATVYLDRLALVEFLDPDRDKLDLGSLLRRAEGAGPAPGSEPDVPA